MGSPLVSGARSKESLSGRGEQEKARTQPEMLNGERAKEYRFVPYG
jgi:hypothetical protein